MTHCKPTVPQTLHILPKKSCQGKSHSSIMLHYIVLYELQSLLYEVNVEWVTQTLCYTVLFFKCYIVFLMRLSLNGLLKHHKTLNCSSSAK